MRIANGNDLTKIQRKRNPVNNLQYMSLSLCI